MHRSVGIKFLASILLFAGGCFETEEDYVLNPDGSGKVVFKSVFQTVNIMGDEEEGSEEEMKSAVTKILEESSGVDAWKDVTFKRTDDGRISFKGTAYFKNISKLDVKAGGIETSNLRPCIVNTPDGKMVLELKDGKEDGRAVKKAPVNLKEEEITAKIKAEKAKYQKSKAMLAGMLANMKMVLNFKMPGTIEKTTNFTKQEDGTLCVTVKGESLLKAMDEFAADDAWWRLF